jgi:long-chain-fatty-acid--CoA ligase ACSBG
MTVSSPATFKVGSCGPPMPGVEIKIDRDPMRDKPGEGEITYRGRHIMLGYMKSDDKTREAIDPDGWLHSGDVGRLDADGFLYITGRIKELIITAGGENIAPVPIENDFKRFCPGLSNVMMVGDKKKFIVCLVTIKTKPLPDGSFGDELDGDASRSTRRASRWRRRRRAPSGRRTSTPAARRPTPRRCRVRHASRSGPFCHRL